MVSHLPQRGNLRLTKGRFYQHFRPNFSPKQNERLFLANCVWRMAKGVCKNQAILANIDLILAFNVVGEIEWKFFLKTPNIGNFSLGEKSLVKSTTGLCFRIPPYSLFVLIQSPPISLLLTVIYSSIQFSLVIR